MVNAEEFPKMNGAPQQTMIAVPDVRDSWHQNKNIRKLND